MHARRVRFFFLVGIGRTAFPFPGTADLGPLVIGISLVYIAMELLMLRQLRKAIANNASTRGAAWRTHAIAECLFPVLGMWLIIATTTINPFSLLASAGYAFIIVIIALSVLRLDPKGVALTGGAGTIGYALLVVYSIFKTDGETDNPMLFVNLTGMLVIATVAITFVTSSVRGYVLIAVREMETRRQRDQLQRDLDLASEIQRSLLPATMPVLPGYTLAAMSRPADQAGGDYYDWQASAENRIVISLADVTGHGIGPALVTTAACRAYLRACVHSASPMAAVIQSVNKLLFEDMRAGRFVTLALLELDPVANTAIYLSAGHAPTLHVNGMTGEIGSLDAQGVPLGLMEDSIIDEAVSLDFAPGDLLVLFTDGFYEWANTVNEQFGLERLKEVVILNRGETAQAILERLDDTVRAFVANSRQPDDMTAVVIKRD